MKNFGAVFKNNKPGKKTLSAIVAGSISLGAPLTLGHEGMRLVPYYDSVGVLTWCGGETDKKHYKPKFTYAECSDLFKIQYGFYSYATSDYYNDTGKAIVNEKIHAAFTDMSYNVGLSRVKTSGMIRNINAGDPVAACNVILEYKKAGGMDCSKTRGMKNGCYGVWERRLQMHKLCMEGALDAAR